MTNFVEILRTTRPTVSYLFQKTATTLKFNFFMGNNEMDFKLSKYVLLTSFPSSKLVEESSAIMLKNFECIILQR